VDLQGRVLLANRGLLDLTRYHKHELVGRLIFDTLVIPEDLVPAQASLRQAAALNDRRAEHVQWPTLDCAVASTPSSTGEDRASMVVEEVRFGGGGTLIDTGLGAAGLAADDASGVGVADDVVIPEVVAAGTRAAAKMCV
jgi:PAS domain-containing protein